MDLKEMEWESSSYSGQGPVEGSSERGKEIAVNKNLVDFLSN
jgi:hypothetical protein